MNRARGQLQTQQRSAWTGEDRGLGPRRAGVRDNQSRREESPGWEAVGLG